MNKLLLSLIVGILLISTAMALDSLGTFKQGQVVRITQVCADATYINISSISRPDSVIVVGNTAMTSAGSGEYYYNFNTTSTLGRYDVRGISDGCSGSEKTFAMYFEVTSTGVNSSSSSDIWVPLFLFLAGIILLVFASWVLNEYFGLFSGMLLIVSGIYMLVYGLGSINDMYTRTIAYVLGIGLGIIISFVSVIEMFYSWGEENDRLEP